MYVGYVSMSVVYATAVWRCHWTSVDWGTFYSSVNKWTNLRSTLSTTL